MPPKHPVDRLGFPLNPVLRTLEDKLCDLAAEWRGSLKRRVEIKQEYEAIFQELYELGWDGFIELECELPAEHLPKEYLKKIHPLTPPPPPSHS